MRNVITWASWGNALLEFSLIGLFCYEISIEEEIIKCRGIGRLVETKTGKGQTTELDLQ